MRIQIGKMIGSESQRGKSLILCEKLKTSSWCLAVAMSLLITLASCTKKNDPVPLPEAQFTFSIGQNGTVTFTNTSTNAQSFLWDFGDGGTESTDKNPTYQYSGNGTYTVKLNATSSIATDSTKNSVVINGLPSTITYVNNTFTTVQITFNGASSSFDKGQSISFSGKPNDPIIASAFTVGIGGVGTKITWPLNSTFPSTNQSSGLDVNQNYFYLQIENSSSYYINTVYVNYGLQNQTVDKTTILNFGDLAPWGVGYYQAAANSNIRLESDNVPGGYWFAPSLDLPFTKNQTYVMAIQ